MIRVVLADDHDVVRHGLETILSIEPDIDVVASVIDGAQAAAAARRHDAHVVLMDIEMPGTDGLAGITLVTRANPRTKVIMLTTFDLDEHVAAALESGAVGYLLKSSGRESLVSAIRRASRKSVQLDDRVTRRLVDRFLRDQSAQPPALLDSLTARERDVFDLVARGRSNAEIAETLRVGVVTVKSHVSSILTKTGLRDRIHIVTFAHESGYLRISREP